ncbi:MAG: PAS domain S-box protein [Acidobacteria bacterium]|nr:PAS domain S-box protein [Acidobacteriota bacterium]MBV9477580.1 PAS domain S-box protein [Acidobacteriota bacterium]
MPPSLPDNFLELMHDPAIVFEPEQEIVLDVNARACDVYGRARNEFIGLSLRQISHDPDTGMRRIEETLAQPSASAFRTVQFRRDGRELVIAVRATPIDYQGRTAILSINREVEHDAGSDAIVQVDDRVADWQFTLDSLPAAVLHLDDDRRILHANRRAREIAGIHDAATLIGRVLEDAGDGEPWSGAARLLRLARENDVSMTGKVDDESHRSWSVSATPAPRGSRMRSVVVLSDITAIADLEAEMHRVEAMAEFGQVVAGVAHEVRTPLFALATTLEVLQGSIGAGDERARLRFEMMRAQIMRLNALMHDLLEYGKAPALDVAPQTLTHSIADALQLNAEAARTRGVTLRNEFPAAAPLVLIDASRMITALRNVIENALQHAPAQSEVVVRGGTNAAQDRVLCVIEDAGAGFRAQDLPSVMEPFFTRRSGGTGLGLAIVHRIVELHGGSVTAENRAEGGARITIELPRAS